MVPNLDAGGALAYGKRLLLDIDGRLAKWPEAWPALPPPIGASDAPLPFALRYLGRTNFHDAASLQLRHEDTRFDARFRLPEVTAWMSSIANGSRSEEHTSELQSPMRISSAVFCLKKKKNTYHTSTSII